MEAFKGVLLPILLILFSVFTSPVLGARSCVQCTSDESKDCINNPPPPTPCTEGRYKFCAVVRERNAKTSQVVFITRTCSPVDIGTKCHESFNEEGEELVICPFACDENGCNGEPPKQKPSSKIVTTSSASYISSMPIVLIMFVALIIN